MRQDGAIPIGECAPNQTVAHVATVDEKVLRIARRAPLARGRNKPAHARHLLVPSLDLQQISVIVQGERIADLRQIIRECIDDSRLRRRLLQLVAMSAPEA